MLKRIRAAGACLLLAFGLHGTAVQAADHVDTLARDVDRVVALRDVKDLQRSYAHLAQFGRWNEMAALFTSDARFIHGKESISGRQAIAQWLTRRGGGRQGLEPGQFHVEFIDQPLANMSVDGRSVKVRWMSLTWTGDGKGGTGIAGGIYQNEYVHDGQGWKISLSHYHAHYEGSYAEGWRNVDGADIPVTPYHFTLDETGVPIPPPAGAAARSGRALPALVQTIDRLNDEDAVRNLQHAYGYYVDRKMWDDVVDLFVDDAVVEIAGEARFTGRDGVRRAMERMGAAGLQQGQLNDRPQFDTIVRVLPGGREAIARSIELGTIGDVDRDVQYWEVSVLRNHFVKEGDLWKLKSLHIHPVMRADFAQGWGDGSRFPNRGAAPPAFLDVAAGSAGAAPRRGKHW